MSDWDYMEDSEDVFTGTSECNNVSEPKSCKDILKNVDKDLAKVKHYHNSLEESHEIIEDSDMRHMPHMLARRANTMYVSVRNFLLLIALPGSFLVIVLFLAIYFTRRDAKSGQ